ncbi:keratin, type I cytoskeletal 9-like [Antrostomus carolinensis]|uniref:keratin, type I cytoskeletal 9-like n=1 Tax=Antrostomus carolinensis TaxID=279965 RepID=UPI00052831F3|nr:keratin, type I cytoskeletal 9-like [Antrostomus carolinensis]
MKKISQYLRRRCARRNRGYGNERSHHRRFNSSRSSSSLRGHGSFHCAGEGSIVYSRRSSSGQPMPMSPPYSIDGGYRGDRDGPVVITSGDNEGTSGWGDIGGGTVPAYGIGGGIGSSGEDLGHNIIGSSGSSCHSGKPVVTLGGGSGYGYHGGQSGYGKTSPAMQQKCPVVIPKIEPQQSKKTNHWPLSQKK